MRVLRGLPHGYPAMACWRAVGVGLVARFAAAVHCVGREEKKEVQEINGCELSDVSLLLLRVRERRSVRRQQRRLCAERGEEGGRV